MKNRLLSSKPTAVLAALLLALVMASSTAFASSSTGTTYSKLRQRMLGKFG